MKNEQISELLQSRIEANDFPSAVYLVAEKGEIVFQDALGFAVLEPDRREAKLDTIYDLASMTKVLVTGLLCAKLIEIGAISLDDRVQHFFPEVSGHKGHVSIRNLLTHTSGFQAWVPFYLFAEKREDIFRNVMLTTFKDVINTSIIYSDLNFILLGILLEKVCGKRLDKIANEELFEPLNLKNTFFNPPKELQKQIAASEFGNQYELKTVVESKFDVQNKEIRNPQSAIRNHQIWGEVHDGNCWFMDGVSGHAGLFSNAAETFRIAQQFLAEETILLKPETCGLFRTNFTPGLNEARSIAFQLAETPESAASNALSKDSFGHLGFTGTSVWIEPENERIFILLTNRTHAHAPPFVLLNSVRRRFHELAQEGLDSKL